MDLLYTKYMPNEVQAILDAANVTKESPSATGTKGKLYEICKYIKFFRGVEYDKVLAITKDITFRRYKKGEIIVKEGSTENDIYYVIKGEVGVFKKVDSVRRKHIASIHEGQIFGEMATLMEMPRSATIAVVQEGTTLLSFEMAESTSTQNADAYALFYKNMARDLAFKLDDTNKKIFAAG